jgi:hypothetical protein
MDDITQNVLSSLEKLASEGAQKLKEEGLLPVNEDKYDSTINDREGDEGGVGSVGQMPS